MEYGGYGWIGTTEPSIMNIVFDIYTLLPYNIFKYIVTPTHKELSKERLTLINPSIPYIIPKRVPNAYQFRL